MNATKMVNGTFPGGGKTPGMMIHHIEDVPTFCLEQDGDFVVLGRCRFGVSAWCIVRDRKIVDIFETQQEAEAAI